VQNPHFSAKLLSEPSLQGALAACLVESLNQAASADHEISVGALTAFSQSGHIAMLVNSGQWPAKILIHSKKLYIHFWGQSIKLTFLNVGLHEFCDDGKMVKFISLFLFTILQLTSLLCVLEWCPAIGPSVSQNYCVSPSNHLMLVSI